VKARELHLDVAIPRIKEMVMAKKKVVKRQRTSKGQPGEEQDIKRRLGQFTGKGEHARQGSRGRR
jgi:hypothetical protein